MKVEYDAEAGMFRLVDGQQHPLLQRANDFLDAVTARGLSSATVRAYAYDLVILARWLEKSDRRLEALQPADLVDFIRSQRETGAHPRSINRRLITCRLIYRFVAGNEIGGLQGVSLPGPHYKGPGRGYLGLHARRQRRQLALRVKTPHTVVEPLTRKQVVAFLRSLRRYRDLAVVYLMLFCGLRSSEVLSLRTSDVDVLDRRLRIHGKGNRERMLPLPEELLQVLNDYIRLERPSDAMDGPLFVVLQGKRRGHPMTTAGLRSLFRYRRGRFSGTLANANAHRFRHTFGADMARAGVKLPVLQRMMGHADAKMTLQYIHLSMADIAAEYQRAIKIITKRYEQD
ncbi:MAG: tyrosine-type recombinase/integrase [bacterium]|nr:tyrosine-type recombinase/integrase [bacterium]